MWPNSSPNSTVNGAASAIIGSVVIAMLYFGRDLLMPLALAGVASFLMEPIVKRLCRVGLSRNVSVSCVIFGVVLFSVGSIGLMASQARRLAEALPVYEPNLRAKLHTITHPLPGNGVWNQAFTSLQALEAEVFPPSVSGQPAAAPAEITQAPVTRAMSYLTASIPTASTFFLVLLLTTFLLLQYHDIRVRIIRLMGESEIGRSAQALDDIGADLANYFFLQTILNSIFGLVIGLSMWALGVPAAWLWGMLSALMRFVPYVGSILSAGPPILIASTIDPGWLMPLGALVVFGVAELACGQFIEPLLLGHRTRMSPLAVVSGAAFWAFLWGPVGLFLATPLTLGLVVLGHHVSRLSFFAIMLGNEPPLKRPEHFYHQLLSGDSYEAAETAGEHLEEGKLAAYLDEVVVPAFNIAAHDHAVGILVDEHAARVVAATREFVDFLKALRPGLEAGEAKSGRKYSADGGPVSLLALGGRGPFDQACGELLALCFDEDADVNVATTEMAGLNGLMGKKGEGPDIVLVISVGGCSLNQLAFIGRKASQIFPNATVLQGYLGDDVAAAHISAIAPEAGVCLSNAAMVEAIERAVHTRRATLATQPTDQIRQSVQIAG